MQSTLDDLRLRVERRIERPGDVVEFYLSSGTPLPAFRAGAHIDLRLEAGLVRSYSLVGTSLDPFCYRIAVKLEPASRGGSQWIHNCLNEGMQLSASAPKGRFGLQNTEGSVFVAAGIGITPLIGMADELSASGQPFTFYYLTRGQGAFDDELADKAWASSIQRHDSLANGRFDLSKLSDSGNLYACGPSSLLVALRDQVTQGRLWIEAFSNDVETTGGEFEIELASSGEVISVPEHQSALQALLEAGIDAPFACEEGICGTCVSRVLDGQIDHRDEYLTEQEQAAGDQMALCCSRGIGRIKIEI